jgi:ubiquinone/menaquinone biosynthesis C-methylase UbiE
MSSKNLWDSISSSYDKKFGPEYERIIKRITRELRPEDEVLEVACGTGLVCFPAAERCRSILGIDFSERMIEVAREKQVKAKVDNVEFATGDAMELSRFRSRFDAVILCNMLHVVPDPARALEEAALSLKPGGRALIATYCHGEKLKPRAAVFSLGMRFLHALGLIPSMHRLSYAQTIKLVTGAGLRVIKAQLITGEGFPCAFIVAQVRD